MRAAGEAVQRWLVVSGERAILKGASARNRLSTQAVLREPLAAGSYSEYLAMANWDVRAHEPWHGRGRPRSAACARDNRISADLMAGLVKRAKRSWRRAARSIREQRSCVVRRRGCAAASGRPATLPRHAVRRPRHLPHGLRQLPPHLRQGVALGAAGAASHRPLRPRRHPHHRQPARRAPVRQLLARAGGVRAPRH